MVALIVFEETVDPAFAVLVAVVLTKVDSVVAIDVAAVLAVDFAVIFSVVFAVVLAVVFATAPELAVEVAAFCFLLSFIT